MGYFEIEPRRPLLIPRPGGVRIDGSATKRGPQGERGPAGPGADEAVQVATSQQAGTAMRAAVAAGTVGVLVIGDSKTAGTGLTSYADRWQDRLVSLLRARFPISSGDTMRGLIPANMSDPYNAMSGRPTFTGTVLAVDTAGLGYNTAQLELGSTVTWPAATWPAGTHALPIGYHTHSGASGTLQVLIDGVVQTEINCAGTGEGEPKRTSIPITAGTHTVSMRPKAGTAPVRVLYAEQRSASTGWHLYDASRPGLAARHVIDRPGAPQGGASFAAAVAQLPGVRLTVVALGANDMTISTPAQYGRDVRAVVDMVKTAHPLTGVVVVLPAALTDDSAVVDDVSAYHTAARAALVDVPDLSVLAETQLVDLTGPNAPAWLADSVHPNAFGHDVIARALAGSLVGLDGPTDALTMVEAAAAPAVAAAQAAQTSAGAAATSAAQAATRAENAEAAALEVPDANVSALVGNPATQTRQALDGALSPVRGGTAIAAPTWGARATTTVVGVGVLADGVLYGVTGTVLKSSVDAGSTWTTVRDLGGSDEVIRIMDTSDGEVLIVRNYAIYRTTGWSTNKTTATITNVRAVSGQSSFYPWGVDANPATGLCVATTYVGSPPYNDSRYLWKSTDGGKTWAVVYDLADHVTEVGTGSDTLATAHMHIAAIDPWAGDRIWSSWHGSTMPSGVVMWSDDGGATWSKLKTSLHPTVGVATKHGMVWGSDDLPQGVYVTPRTANPANQVFKFAWRWPANADGLVGWGHWGTRTPDGEIAFIAFISDLNDPPVVAQSDGITASMMLQGPVNTTVRTDGYRGIHYVNGRLLAYDRRGTGWTVEKALHNQTRIPATDPDADPGWVLGGNASGARAIAVGMNSTATASQAIALGTEAAANQVSAIAIGDKASVGGSAAVAIGVDSVAGVRTVSIGENANSVGPDATAVGRLASTTGQYPTAVGAEAAAKGSYSTAYGYKAVINGSSSVAVGAGATGKNSTVSMGRNAAAGSDLTTVVGHSASTTTTAAYGTALGQASIVGANYGTALGQAANVAAGHLRSVALGSTAATTAADQVQVGARHIELTELAATPAAAGTDAARLFVRDDGAGKTQVCVRFNTGAVVVIATQP